MNDTNYRVKPKVLASKEKRFINMIIDLIGYYALSFILGIMLGILALMGIEEPLDAFGEMGILGNLVFTIVLNTTYFMAFEVPTQRTLGKYITKTMVVLEDGSKPGAETILVRSLCRLIPFEAFSFLGELGRGWHDSISDTYVVDIRKFEDSKIAESEIDLIGQSQDI